MNVSRQKAVMVVRKQAKPLSLYCGTLPFGVMGPLTILPGSSRMMTNANTEYATKVHTMGGLGTFT